MAGLKWTETQEIQLKKFFAEKGPRADLSQFAIKSDRSLVSIRNKAIRLGLKPSSPERARAKWSKEEKHQLQLATNQGLTAEEIFKNQGLLADKTYNAISKQMGRMQLVKERPNSKLGLNYHKLSEESELALNIALRFFAKKMPREYFSWYFSISRSQVKKFEAALLGETVSWQVRHQVGKSFNLTGVRNTRNHIAKAWDRKKTGLVLELIAEKRQIETEISGNPALALLTQFQVRQCVACKADWYNSDKFFGKSSRHKSNPTARYLKSTCRCCSPHQNDNLIKNINHKLQLVEKFKSLKASLSKLDLLPNSFNMNVDLAWKPFRQEIGNLSPSELHKLISQVFEIYDQFIRKNTDAVELIKSAAKKLNQVTESRIPFFKEQVLKLKDRSDIIQKTKSKKLGADFYEPTAIEIRSLLTFPDLMIDWL